MSDPIQSQYPIDYNQCYGCGQFNPAGLHIESIWEGDVCVCRFTPGPQHMAVPGFVYGGLLASLIDCHSIAAASTLSADFVGEFIGGPIQRFVTAALKVDYLHPTPLGPELIVRATGTPLSLRKVQVVSELSAGGPICVRGEVLAVRLPDTMAGPVQPAD